MIKRDVIQMGEGRREWYLCQNGISCDHYSDEDKKKGDFWHMQELAISIAIMHKTTGDALNDVI